MEEYLAYSEITQNSLVPLVATVSAARDSVTYRDLVKDDILYLVDPVHHDHEDPDHPMKVDPLGGWLFKNSGANKSSWVRRYINHIPLSHLYQFG